jgi:GGDEF domain-containing protein
MALAVGKADQIRARITEMTAPGGLAATASLGVAAIPESAAGPTDLLPNADAALYGAKKQRATGSAQHRRGSPVQESPGIATLRI